MIVDEDGFRVWKEPWKDNREPIEKLDAAVPIESHIQNFLDCVKSRKEPNATVEVGATAVAGPIWRTWRFTSTGRSDWEQTERLPDASRGPRVPFPRSDSRTFLVGCNTECGCNSRSALPGHCASDPEKTVNRIAIWHWEQRPSTASATAMPRRSLRTLS